MDQQVIAIIPARGRSKGIPRKNILPLAGKPLIAYTIEAALRAQTVNRVVVSTDDAEIGLVASKYDAEVIQRPADISGDLDTSELALLHVLGYLKESEDYEPDIVVFLQCTSPLTTAVDIDGVVEALKRDAADSALAVVPFHYFLWNRDGTGINHNAAHRPLRQDADPQYLEAGAVYVMKTAGFRQHKHRFFGKTALHVMPQHRVLEIDTEFDFELAEFMMSKYGS